MIDPQVFEQEIAILMDWFNRDFEPETLKRLYQRLSKQLSTEQFVQASQIVFDSSRFFPTIEEFVAAVKGDASSLALQEWDLCVLAAARDDREMLKGLSTQGRSALHLVGGLYKLGMATEDQLTWIKKEFVGVWKATSSDVTRLPTSNNCESTSSEVVRSLSQKMSFNGR